jgi:L-rhamnose-H+ transport protein
MNSLLGIVFHAIGGFASGSFYLPFRKVKVWSWETAWLSGGFASWLVIPLITALLTVNNWANIMAHTSPETLFWTYFFGALWGIGGLSFGLAVRYLGISLGMAIALGYCAAFGTLIPPIYAGKWNELIGTSNGQILLGGVVCCLLGIAICGYAGIRKEAELSVNDQKAAVKEYNLKLGMGMATLSGILSACFAFALNAGMPIATSAIESGTNPLWQNNAIYPVLLLGGFTSNFIWCVVLHLKNKSAKEYLDVKMPLVNNYTWAFIAGTTWFLQFLFYGMGDAYLGIDYRFAGWTLHMSFIILFSSGWGLILNEWKGSSGPTKMVLYAGLFTILLSAVLIGFGNG